jgi:hypothetical protein
MRALGKIRQRKEAATWHSNQRMAGGLVSDDTQPKPSV